MAEEGTGGGESKPGGGGGGGGPHWLRGVSRTIPGIWFPFAYMHCWYTLSYRRWASQPYT